MATRNYSIPLSFISRFYPLVEYILLKCVENRFTSVMPVHIMFTSVMPVHVMFTSVMPWAIFEWGPYFLVICRGIFLGGVFPVTPERYWL